MKFDIQKFFYSIDHSIMIKLIRKHVHSKWLVNLLIRIVRGSPTLVGLPLGNLLSQILANLYLNSIDQWAKRKLGIKFYVRYADDIVIMVKDKQTATYVHAKMKEYLYNVLKLTVHPTKTRIQPGRHGLDTLGFKVFSTHTILGGAFKRKTNRTMKNIKASIGLEQTVRIEGRLNSWLAHTVKAKCNHYLEAVANRFAFFKFQLKTRLPGPIKHCVKLVVA